MQHHHDSSVVFFFHSHRKNVSTVAATSCSDTFMDPTTEMLILLLWAVLLPLTVWPCVLMWYCGQGHSLVHEMFCMPISRKNAKGIWSHIGSQHDPQSIVLPCSSNKTSETDAYIYASLPVKSVEGSLTPFLSGDVFFSGPSWCRRLRNWWLIREVLWLPEKTHRSAQTRATTGVASVNVVECLLVEFTCNIKDLLSSHLCSKEFPNTTYLKCSHLIDFTAMSVSKKPIRLMGNGEM